MLRERRRRRFAMVGILVAALLPSPRPAVGEDDDPDELPGYRQFVRPVIEAGGPGIAWFPAEYVGDQVVEIVDPRGYSIHIRNAVLYLGAQPLELVAGTIESFTGRLAARPLLEVSLVLPPRVRLHPFALEVWKLPEEERLAVAELRRDAGRHRFQDTLVHGLLEVRLVSPVGAHRQRVDLTVGQEAFVELAPELIEVHGTVRRAGVPVRATVAFQTVAGDPVVAITGEDGTYLAVALQPLASVEVWIAGEEPEPWHAAFPSPIGESREIDFEVSRPVSPAG